jgi:hypothetical protein
VPPPGPVAIRSRTPEGSQGLNQRIIPARRRGTEAPYSEGFTLSAEGETLRDVAVRVYGSTERTEALWRLNRDLVGERDAPLAAGTLLRTP